MGKPALFVIDANALDFEVVVSIDACGASEQTVHPANLRDSAGICIQSASTRELIEALPNGLGRGLRLLCDCPVTATPYRGGALQ